MTGALLPNIETGQGEPEDVHLVQQGVQLFTTQRCADQAVADQLEIAAERVHRHVMQGLSDLQPVDLARFQAEPGQAGIDMQNRGRRPALPA